jgi:nucleotide-binding universal stress UspA family protein
MPRLCRIIAGVSGSPRCLPALRYAADLARATDAVLIPVHVWVPSGLELAGYQFPSEHVVWEWQDAAWQRLRHALEMAFGGPPPGIVAQPLIAQGSAGPVLVSVVGLTGDALVIGTGRRGAASRLRHGMISRYCLAHASCPVIAVPPPALDLAAAHRRLRHKTPSAEDTISDVPQRQRTAQAGPPGAVWRVLPSADWWG